jgi:hypothetical protein
MENDAEMGLEETGAEVVNCIQLPQDRNQWKDLVNTVPDVRVP